MKVSGYFRESDGVFFEESAYVVVPFKFQGFVQGENLIGYAGCGTQLSVLEFEV